MAEYHLTFRLIPPFSEEVNFNHSGEVVCMHGCSTDYLLTVLNICCDEKPWQRKSCLHTGANDWVFQRAHSCIHIPNPTQVRRRHDWCMVKKESWNFFLVFFSLMLMGNVRSLTWKMSKILNVVMCFSQENKRRNFFQVVPRSLSNSEPFASGYNL